MDNCSRRDLSVVLLTSLFVTAPEVMRGQIVIHEVVINGPLASTDKAASGDWLELKNLGERQVYLADYSVSDQLVKSALPNGFLQPGEHMVLKCWGSEGDWRAGVRGYNSGFSLSNLGEVLSLTGREELTVERVEVPPQQEEWSFGRHGDGTGKFRHLQGRTVSFPNDDGSLVRSWETVHCAPPAGYYDQPIHVHLCGISEKLGGSIRYTLDGSEPDGNSLEYTGPLLRVAQVGLRLHGRSSRAGGIDKKKAYRIYFRHIAAKIT